MIYCNNIVLVRLQFAKPCGFQYSYSQMAKRKPAEQHPALKIEYWPIDRLQPYARNPRRNDKAVGQMVASIREYGFTIPVLAKSDGLVIDGHLRLKAAVQMQLAEVPVIPCDTWTEAQVKAFRLMVNRSVAWADWDMDALALEFGDLKALDFDLTLTGFADWETGWTKPEGEGTATPEWTGMPEFEQQDKLPWQTVQVHFVNSVDRDAFAALTGQLITDKTKYIWHPKQERINHTVIRYTSSDPQNPKFPVYIISKGRAQSRLTSKALEELKIPYRIVIEAQEYDQYAAVIDPVKILVLPFSNLGQGGIPARNWVWEHALSEGAKRHWILDDNIQIFMRLHNNLKVPLADGSCFKAAEDYVDQFTNVALAGFQYTTFAHEKQKMKPCVFNTRIYSCILIDNALPFRWRGRYNEDTDLSLRVLKSGMSTVLFSAFLAAKVSTMTMKGGNTDQLYQGDGRLKMAESLREQHPDVVKVVRKWNRWQHFVDYRPFKNNKFIPKPGFEVPTEANNYGMELIHIGKPE